MESLPDRLRLGRKNLKGESRHEEQDRYRGKPPRGGANGAPKPMIAANSPQAAIQPARQSDVDHHFREEVGRDPYDAYRKPGSPQQCRQDDEQNRETGIAVEITGSRACGRLPAATDLVARDIRSTPQPNPATKQ